ncbi:MAG TPA: hypothetical protein ENK96_03495 [Desulfobulbaceae bacterium]|nr:hypothetical protein [Desulfobulbaceae bacterium]
MNAIEMQELLVGGQKSYVENIEKAIQLIKEEIKEAVSVEKANHPEWQHSIGGYIDELHRVVFALAEPRYGTDEDHRKIVELRNQVKDLYAYMKNQY